MKAAISTESFDIYTLPIPADPELTRRERERAAALSLVRAVFSPDTTIGHTTEGAPLLEGVENPAPISISHDCDTCLLAVSRCGRTIGADIETPRGQLMRVAPRFLGPEEKARFDGLSDDNEQMEFLLRCWTAKEAVYKCALTPGLALTEIRLSASADTAEARESRYALWFYGHPEEAITAVAVKTEP